MALQRARSCKLKHNLFIFSYYLKKQYQSGMSLLCFGLFI